MTVEQTIKKQQAQKVSLASIFKFTPPKKPRAKPISKADVAAAVNIALANAARHIRFEAKSGSHAQCTALHQAAAIVDSYRGAV